MLHRALDGIQLGDVRVHRNLLAVNTFKIILAFASVVVVSLCLVMLLNSYLTLGSLFACCHLSISSSSLSFFFICIYIVVVVCMNDELFKNVCTVTMNAVVIVVVVVVGNESTIDNNITYHYLTLCYLTTLCICYCILKKGEASC